MGSPPIPDRSPPRPHPGAKPPIRPDSVPFSPPKRKSGGSIKHKESSNRSSPIPTYRHLLGTNNVGAANPLRVIAHIDIDAAYAAMEMVRLNLPEDQPMATQQWNGLIAVNYPARSYGITRHESPAEALKKCPHLKLVHVQTYRNGDTEPGYWEDPPPSPHTHKVSLDMYRKESRKILQVFQEFCPIVEKASIDESFLDLTSTVRSLLLSNYPQLRTVPPSGLDTPLPTPREFGIFEIDWDDEGKVGNLVPSKGQKKEKLIRMDSNGIPLPPSQSSSPVKPTTTSLEPLEELDLDLNASDEERQEEEEEEDDEEGVEPELSWSDISLSLGARLVHTIRSTTRERLGYTCSAGIATNKMLSKLCSGWKKPNAQTILRNCAVENFLKPMSFQKIRNLGGKLGNAVKETFVVETVGDLHKFELSELQSKLGDDSGVWLWEVCRGLDFTEVEPKTNVKSMLSSKNFRPYIYKYGEVIHWLNILATELHLRLTEAREDSPGLWPKTITFTHRSPTFVIRSHQSSFPYTSNLTISYIFRQAEKLLRVALSTAVPEKNGVASNSSSTSTNGKGANELVNNETKIGPFGNIQLSFSGLERLEEGQKGIAGFFAASSNANGGEAKKEKGKVAMIKDEKGKESVKRAQSEVVEDQARGGGKEDQVPSAMKKRKFDDDDDDDDSSKLITLPSSPSPPPTPRLPTFTCRRSGCSRVLEIPASSLPALVAANYSTTSIKEALKRVEDEERDYHLARDMVEEERKLAGWRTTSNNSGGGGENKQKKRKKSLKEDSGGGKKGASNANKKEKSEKTNVDRGQLGLSSFFKK